MVGDSRQTSFGKYASFLEYNIKKGMTIMNNTANIWQHVDCLILRFCENGHNVTLYNNWSTYVRSIIEAEI